MFISTIVIVWFSLFVNSLRIDGVKKTIRYFFPMIIAALFIEASGVANGRFYYPGYLLYFRVLGGAVPLVILLGWSSNLYLFLHLGKNVISQFTKQQRILHMILISLTAATIGICLDILEDPLAHTNQWWIWREPATTMKIFSVPLSNYLDWFIILFSMSFATLLIEKTGFSENRKVLLSFSSLPIVLLFILGGHIIIATMVQVLSGTL
jgi:uncharacterized membrane protein